MIPTVAREIRTLRKSVDALNRRLAASHMTGKVVEIKGDKVRLELMPPDPRTGKPFLSPWVQVQESAGDGVGGYSTHVPVAVGETMRLLSPHGEVGPQSLAVRDGYTRDNPRPTEEDQQLVIKHGDARIEITRNAIVIGIGGTALRITADELVTTARTRLNNGTRKVHHVEARDEAGHRAIEGADDVLV
ncbi:phage baseplate protein [Stappia stellulata]|uniref:phage baseplate protein n=1 Tax=Stappia stellulata TaxID=71235 RepID=UPI001CD3FC9D|nr:phage baseplate protein [Stappia stellulata]MCA1242945.1 phage baseplate protein [Stappia stellulata]